MTDKRRLLIVTSEFPPQPGGIGNHAYNLAKHMAYEGFTVQVIADQRSYLGEEEGKFDSLLQFKVHRIGLRKLRLLMYIKRLQLLFKVIKSSDLVIASGKFSLWSVAFFSLFFKRSYTAVIHGSEVNFTNSLLKASIKLSLQRFSKLIAVSNYTKRLVSHVHADITVIPNGIDLEVFNHVSIGKIDLQGDPKLITVGNITQRKGQLNVIKHLPALVQVYPNLHYHCIGLPTEKAAFLKFAESLNAAHHITFHGRVEEVVLHDMLRSSDVFVMLSSSTATGDTEGFGIALIEANYFGLPCIGAKDCGIEDAISDYESGLLIRYDDTEAFINALKNILSRRDSFEQGAKAWAMKHDWKIITKRYIEVMNTIS